MAPLAQQPPPERAATGVQNNATGNGCQEAVLNQVRRRPRSAGDFRRAFGSKARSALECVRLAAALTMGWAATSCRRLAVAISGSYPTRRQAAGSLRSETP